MVQLFCVNLIKELKIFVSVRAECDVAFICRTYVKHNVDPENATRDGKFFRCYSYILIFNEFSFSDDNGHINQNSLSFSELIMSYFQGLVIIVLLSNYF